MSHNPDIQGALNGTHPALPIAKKLDLTVNGSGTPVSVSVSVDDYTYITRLIWKFEFADNTIEWTNFGAGSALTNGINVFYHQSNIFPQAIKSNSDFFDYGYDVNLQKDGAATPGNVLSARWSFDKWVPHGLGMWNSEAFSIQIADDLRTVTRTDITSLFCIIEGWKSHP